MVNDVLSIVIVSSADVGVSCMVAIVDHVDGICFGSCVLRGSSTRGGFDDSEGAAVVGCVRNCCSRQLPYKLQRSAGGSDSSGKISFYDSVTST